jgi:hypothetical protein
MTEAPVKNHESDTPRVPIRRVAGDMAAARPLTAEVPPLATRGSAAPPAQPAEADAVKDSAALKGTT